MLQKISQHEFNRLYIAYRYHRAYLIETYDISGELHRGFNLIKLLNDHQFSLTLCKLHLRNLDFQYAALSGIEFIQCDLSYTLFEGVDLSHVLFSDCLLSHTNLPFHQTYTSHESLDRRSQLDLIKLDCLDALA